MSNSHKRRRAFTLVELLVVIGIIAILISILMPALSRMRGHANALKCLSNLRQIGQALVLYAGESKGSYPYGSWDGANNAPDGTFVSPMPTTAMDWSTLLNGRVFTKSGRVTYGDYLPASIQPGTTWSPIFTCPVAASTPTNTSGRILHYASHPRLMPRLDDRDKSITPNPLSRPYKLGRVRRSSEIILVWDAMQNLTTDGNANAVCTGLDQDGYYSNGTLNGRRWSYLINDGTVDMSIPIYAPNKDYTGGAINGAYDINNIRWRHGRRDKANFVFADGHAETRGIIVGRSTGIRTRNCYID